MIKKIPLWVVPLIFAVITFLNVDIGIATDMALYMDSAINLFKGYGYVDMERSPMPFRGPGFPLMIAGAFWLLGVSAQSAFWVIRIFAILNPLMVYFIGQRFYGRWVGLAASLFVLTSYSVSFWSYRHLDHIWPFFVLLAILLLYRAFEESKYIWFILSGVSLGFASLIKEVALVFFPVSFLLLVFVGEYRSWRNLVRVAILGLVLLLTIFPWIYISYINSSLDPLQPLGQDGTVVLRNTLLPHGSFNLYSIIKNYIIGLGYYYGHPKHDTLSKNFLVAPIFILAWGFTFLSGLKGSRKDLIMLFSFLLFSPLMSFLGRENWRLGQGIVFFLLSFIVTAHFLLVATQYLFLKLADLFGNRKVRGIAERCVVAGVILAVSLLQLVAGEKSGIDFLENSLVVKKFLGQEIPEMAPYGIAEKTAEWILNMNLSSPRVMTDRYHFGRIIYFLMGGDYPVYEMPIITVHKDFVSQGRMKGNIISLSAWLGDCDDPRDRFFVIDEIDLLDKIKNRDINCILTTSRWSSNYFEQNSGFVKVAEPVKGVSVFAVKQVTPVDSFETIIDPKAVSLLECLSTDQPERYHRIKAEFFEETLGWSEDEIEKILVGNGRP